MPTPTRDPNSVPPGGDAKDLDGGRTQRQMLAVLDAVTEYIRRVSSQTETTILITFKDGVIDFPNMAFDRAKGITEEQVADCLEFCARVIRAGKSMEASHD